MRVDYSDPAEADLEELDNDEEEIIRKEIRQMSQSDLPDPEEYDVNLATWNGELRYRLKLVDADRGLDHRILFRFVNGGKFIEILAVFDDRDELEYK